MSKRHQEPRLFEYRIQYNFGAENCEINNYHYYMACNAQEAFDFHIDMLKKNNIVAQNISVEKFDPYAQEWKDSTPNIDSYDIQNLN